MARRLHCPLCDAEGVDRADWYVLKLPDGRKWEGCWTCLKRQMVEVYAFVRGLAESEEGPWAVDRWHFELEQAKD